MIELRTEEDCGSALEVLQEPHFMKKKTGIWKYSGNVIYDSHAGDECAGRSYRSKNSEDNVEVTR